MGMFHCYFSLPEAISSYGCFHKWWYPPNTPKWSFLVGKPMVVGYHHFWKPPYRAAKCFITPVVFAPGLVHWSVTLDPGPSSPMRRHNPPRWLQRCGGWWFNQLRGWWWSWWWWSLMVMMMMMMIVMMVVVVVDICTVSLTKDMENPGHMWPWKVLMVFKKLPDFPFREGRCQESIHACPTELPSNIGKKCHPNSEIWCFCLLLDCLCSPAIGTFAARWHSKRWSWAIFWASWESLVSDVKVVENSLKHSLKMQALRFSFKTNKVDNISLAILKHGWLKEIH